MVMLTESTPVAPISSVTVKLNVSSWLAVTIGAVKLVASESVADKETDTPPV